MIKQAIFLAILIAAIYFFYKNVKIITRNINLGRDIKINDNRFKRWLTMFKVAIGQSKMISRPVAGILHIFVYVGFIIVNFEMMEILIDGIFGTHRFFAFIGKYYNILISSFELFAFSVTLACAIFLIRRNILRIKRFWNKEMTLWPRSDANIILTTEILLMSAILIMNATDSILQTFPGTHFVKAGNFTLSSIVQPLFTGFSYNNLVTIERFCWWFHIIGVLAFLNYIPYSKHFHVFLSFPNVYYSKLRPKGEIANMPSVTKEVKIMLNQAIPASAEDIKVEVFPFGAKNLKDLTWKNLMDAYSCTECGRCTSSCPANITGKKLSPRKVLMDVRDHLEITGKDIDKKRKELDGGKSLFEYITSEELWACTTCNACTQECPVNIDHVSIIIDMRRYLVMEQAAAPSEINTIFSNIENNGAPWQFSPEDRLLWTKDLETKGVIPIMSDMYAKGEKPEYLFWVGCAGAFDDRYKKVARAFTKILSHLEVNFAILGKEESCTGDPARRAGNEMLFQMQAFRNIEIFKSYNVNKIITICPHCFNVFKNEYPELGGNYEVINYTQFLEKYIEEGKLKTDSSKMKNIRITYHDPCYLGRGNDIYQSPRNVISSVTKNLVEMDRNKNLALCCGGGGAQMFKEAEEGYKEIFIERAEDALKTNAKVIATACPFCMTMITDGLKYKQKEEEIKNLDIAELIVQALDI